MRLSKNTEPLPKKLPKPELKWQSGEYAKLQDFRFHLPYSFLLLCKLWNITPNEVLTDFMDNLSCGSWKREGRDEAKVNLLNYIIEMKYGQQHYTEKELLQMFTELDAVGMLWPGTVKEKMMKLHVKWRNKYYNCWFKKWFYKFKRKAS